MKATASKPHCRASVTSEAPCEKLIQKQMHNQIHYTLRVLQDCRLDIISAAAAHILFPVMQTDHGCIQLSGGFSVSNQALGILAAQTRIDELEVDNCSQEMLHMLASFGSLKSLVLIGATSRGPLSLAPLCASIRSAGPPLQLSSLKLVAMHDLTGLDVCLAHHPLQELQLIGVYFLSMAPSVHLASATLKAMRIRLNLSIPIFIAAAFPMLQSIELESFQLKQIPGLSAEVCVQRCSSLASGIASFPCVQLTDVNVWGSGWSSVSFIKLLQGLAPLQPAFQSVKHVCVSCANIGVGAARVIASLFPNLESLALWPMPGHDYGDPEGLIVSVSALPNLKFIHLSITQPHPPTDIIAALFKQPGLTLSLKPRSAECQERLQCVKQSWENAREHMPGQCTATLNVRDVL